ncbi:MAG TPA: DUF177 domain-containing protein [Rhizobacter sp.]|nr:DUF177 domain-containing protein [Rhizobacter sp.]
MRTRDFDVSRLDVEAFAKDGTRLEGMVPLAKLERLSQSVVQEIPATHADSVAWHVQGEQRKAKGATFETWLHVGAETSLLLECQRCLKPMRTKLVVERSYLFVHGEATAAELDAESEDDVLAMTRSLDARELIEDELLLALPLVPRHEICPEPLSLPTDTLAADDEPAPHPFAGLEALKRGRQAN